jgi:alpha-beta hydrolase superfamily lysophospholipase
VIHGRVVLLLLVSMVGIGAVALDAQRPQRVSLRTSDGVSIAASFFETGRRPSPAVVLVPMMTRTRRDWEPVAARLASEGIAALTIDLRGHGESGFVPAPEEGGLASMQEDVVAAYRFLQARTDVLHDRIGIAGASLGANVAVIAAAALPAVRSIALLSPTLDYRGVRIAQSAEKYGARPMLLVASREDAYALRTVRELLNEKLPQREQILLGYGGHGTVMLQRDPSLITALVEWFHRTL